MQGMREAIAGGTFETFQKQTRAEWARGDMLTDSMSLSCRRTS